MSLRARLVLGLLVLAALGLVAADLATYGSLRSFLVQRLDASLQSDHIAVENALGQIQGAGGCGLGGGGGVDREAFVQVRSTAGRVLCTRPASEPPARPPGSTPARPFARGG